MLDEDRFSESGGDGEGGAIEPAEERLQYTIKGIERRSLELMRDAAKQDGMKIGAWVSKRIREAAVASLSENPSHPSNSNLTNERFFGDLMGESDYFRRLVSNSEAMLRRLELIERDIERLHENQRALISGLLARSNNGHSR